MKKFSIYDLSKFILFALFAFIVSFGFTACLENNVNEYQVTEEDMDKDNLKVGGYFNTMLNDIIPTSDVGANAYQRAQNLTGDIYSGYMAHIGTWNSSSHNGTYNLYFDKWNDVAFENGYSKIMGPWFNVQKNTESEVVKGMSTIAKVLGMHRVTDNYGPIPYLQFGTTGLTTPYDSQEVVYQTFFDELNKSIDAISDFLDTNPESRLWLTKYDMIYGGDVLKWVKLGNALKLRLAMRISYINPVAAQAHAESAANHRYGLLTAKADIAQLKSYEGHVVYHPLETIWNSYADIRMGATMDSYLNGYNDPRLPKYFQAATIGGYHGVRNGMGIYNKAPYEAMSSPNIQKETPVTIMTPAEAYFLLAEGVIRGWNMGGTAQYFYNKGIEASFEQHAVSGAAAYITNNTAVPIAFVDKVSTRNIAASSSITIAWEEGDTPDKKLERIITQKWIALYPEGQEAWSEFRRTGYPKIFPIVTNRSAGQVDTNLQIRRIIFPRDEYNKNAEEVAKAVDMLPGKLDQGKTKVWWDAK